MAKASKHESETGAEELFRRLKANPPLFIGTVAVLVLVIVSFVLVPAIPTSDIEGADGELVFGYYNDVPIGYKENNYFGRMFRVNSLMESYSTENDSPEGLLFGDRDMRIWQRTYYASLIHEALLQEMRNAGFKPPTAEIDKEVAKLPDFQEDGRFSLTKYRRYNKNSLLALWKSTEEDFIEKQYKDELSGLMISEAEKTFMGAMSSPERRFRMVSFPRSSYPDSEVASYAASNSAHFRMVHLSKITISSTEKEAQQVLDSVKSGKTSFEDAARNQSKDSYKDQGGDMGVKMAFDLYQSLPDEAQRAGVLALKPGEYSELVEDPAGWAFYMADAAPYNADFSQQENIDKARSYMNQQEGGRMENWLVAKAEEFRSDAKAEGFERAAEKAGLSITEFGPVNLNYGNVSLFQSLAADGIRSGVRNENFWRIAFTTPVNNPSAPFTLDSDVIVLEPSEETIKDDAGKGIIADFYGNGYWMYDVNEADLNVAVSGSAKTKDTFFKTYYERILAPFANAQ